VIAIRPYTFLHLCSVYYQLNLIQRELPLAGDACGDHEPTPFQLGIGSRLRRWGRFDYLADREHAS
jgi:hypothetical protein